MVKQLVLMLTIFGCMNGQLNAQYYERASAFYNTLIGAFTGAIGSVINKKKEEKWYASLIKGFGFGAGGGMLMYSGKKLNHLIAENSKPVYAWLSRAVYSAGNSLVENAAAGRKWWEVWHYDIGFIRLEYQAVKARIQPRIMPSVFLGTLFLGAHGKFDIRTSFFYGTPVFRTPSIHYAQNLYASTPTNGFLMVDTLTDKNLFSKIYAHEMIHAFQFQDFSGVNYFFQPITNKWKLKSTRFAKWSKWIYGDLNYEIMVVNYFFIQKGHKHLNYCENFLENEAETLSTGQPACK
ncbi:MAG TPA: hypothetical protein VK177_18395 [Flavobacteriales bacterium]|nr:hypothetical protein [Flavobacteriales bacterium]